MPTILTKDVKHRKAILKLLLSKGYKWHGESNLTPEIIEERWPYSRWEVVQIRTEDKHICGNYKDVSITHTSIVDFFNDIDNVVGKRVLKNSDE